MSDGWNVVLDHDEIRKAAIKGIDRRIDSWKRGISDKESGADMSKIWQREIEGALNEMAVSKRLGIPWDPVPGEFGAPDVGPYYVRSTEKPNGGLLIHPWERRVMNRIYILLVGTAPKYRLAGWLCMQEAAIPQWHRQNLANRGPCWLVPQSKVRPMHTLPEAP